MSEKPSFFAELKRRNVYKVAVAYAVVGWLVIQVSSTVLPTFHAPEWVVQTLVVLVALGFPIALVIAWAFELTPEGIKRTEDVDRGTEHISRNRAWIYVVILAGALALGLFFVGRYTAPKQNNAWVSTEKSIAVLPFESLSDDKANAYFATGIQEEILTRLAQIADLKVISRTSTQQYQSKAGNLLQIAKQLGVAHVLEGSVQRVNDQVRVNVQLINAQTDAHLWAETYDRKVIDILAVESDISKSIAESLQAKLTGREKQALALKPTNNPEAYDAYLRGLAAEGEVFHSAYAMEKAVGFYEQAVRLDPAFAVAWSRLSRADSDLYSSPNDPTGSRRDAAKRALDVAQKLQPDAPETLLALAYYQFQVLRDYELAKTTFRAASKLLPGNSEIPGALAWIARRQGHWDDAITYHDQALLLDPRNTELLVHAAGNYTDLRQFEAAHKLYNRALDIRPSDPEFKAGKAAVYQAEGNLEQSAKLLDQVDPQTASIMVFSLKLIQLTLERNHSEAVRLGQERVAQFHFGSELEKGVFTTFLAFSQHLAGDNAGARTTAEQARNTLEPLCRSQPDNDFAPIWLSRAYAILGDKNLALREAERGITILPTAKNAALGPGLEENLATIQMMFGENARTISTLERLFKIPYVSPFYGGPLTPALLRLDPTWDPLRSDPAFQKLCEEKPK